MRHRVLIATLCAARGTGLLALVLTAACTDMGPERPTASLPHVVASPHFRTPVPRPTPPPLPVVVEGSPDAGSAISSYDIADPGIQDQPEPGYHRVRAGETIYRIAQHYGVDAYALVTANRLTPPFDVVEGQRLAIPGPAAAAVASSSSPAASPAPTVQSEAAEAEAWHPVARKEAGARPAAPPERTAALPRPPPTLPEASSSEGGFVWPIEGRVLSDFGAKGGGRFNDGINIAAAAGSPVRAAKSGVVAYAGNELRGFGNMLLIKHAGGWVTAYAHNQELLVGRGDSVRRGQVIARAGATGGVEQPQLHFEIRKGKTAVDPLQQLRRPSATAGDGRAAG